MIINLRIDGYAYTGIVVERTKGSRPLGDGSGHVMAHFLIVDLDTRCVLADFSPTPAEIDIAGAWKPAAIDRIPTAPEFRRIMLSYEE